MHDLGVGRVAGPLVMGSVINGAQHQDRGALYASVSRYQSA